ncbi:MAG: hypothetical protein ACLFU0_01875 [Alphaproteobacteria bacterium]
MTAPVAGAPGDPLNTLAGALEPTGSVVVYSGAPEVGDFTITADVTGTVSGFGVRFAAAPERATVVARPGRLVVKSDLRRSRVFAGFRQDRSLSAVEPSRRCNGLVLP